MNLQKIEQKINEAIAIEGDFDRRNEKAPRITLNEVAAYVNEKSQTHWARVEDVEQGKMTSRGYEIKKIGSRIEIIPNEKSPGGLYRDSVARLDTSDGPLYRKSVAGFAFEIATRGFMPGLGA